MSAAEGRPSSTRSSHRSKNSCEATPRLPVRRIGELIAESGYEEPGPGAFVDSESPGVHSEAGPQSLAARLR